MAAAPPTATTPAVDAAHDLYERHGRRIFTFCLHRLGSREEAEDAAQSTFLRAFRSLQRGVEPELERAWLFKIAENVCNTRLRSSSRRRLVESPADLHLLQDVVPSRHAEADELFGLTEALGAMPGRQRRALLLREWHGLSYAEIAAELELSQSAVETLLFRARRSLARGLEQPPAARRLRAGELGAALTALKAFFFGGTAKVAVTVAAVAATSVVLTPPVRHELERVVAAEAPRTESGASEGGAHASARRGPATAVRHAAGVRVDAAPGRSRPDADARRDSSGAASSGAGCRRIARRGHSARGGASSRRQPTSRPARPRVPKDHARRGGRSGGAEARRPAAVEPPARSRTDAARERSAPTAATPAEARAGESSSRREATARPESAPETRPARDVKADSSDENAASRSSHGSRGKRTRGRRRPSWCRPPRPSRRSSIPPCPPTPPRRAAAAPAARR